MDRKKILAELKRHVPFTAFGALSGIVLMTVVVFVGLPHKVSHTIFHTLHPIHVVLSAIITTALYRKYRKGVLTAVVIGLFGSIAIGTFSDALLPYIGGTLLNVSIPLHICVLENPLLIISSAFFGVAAGFMWEHTKVPHAGHVLLSTYASLFYLTTFGSPASWIPVLPFVFVVLFFAVWIPCCVSDILFPLLFVGEREK
ncbi:MAG: hypothetical protein ACLFQ8_03420 [Candidatus Aenigmatarchaeota archaeon]